MTANWENPFRQFLADADAALTKAKSLPNVQSNPGLMTRAVEILEERNFVSDIVVRVRCVATAFDRMRELFLLYREVDEEMMQIMRSSAPGVSSSLYDRLSAACGKYHDEAMMLTSFVYYEISSLVSLLGGYRQIQPASSLKYLVAVRDKLLVHPRESSRIKKSDSVLSRGPILHANLVGGTHWVPSIRKYYESQLSNRFGLSLDEKQGEEANVRAILNSTHHENLPDEARLLLKTYNIPEPSPVDSAKELAAELNKGFLKRLRKACARIA